MPVFIGQQTPTIHYATKGAFGNTFRATRILCDAEKGSIAVYPKDITCPTCLTHLHYMACFFDLDVKALDLSKRRIDTAEALSASAEFDASYAEFEKQFLR